jgi:hypothetical protein
MYTPFFPDMEGSQLAACKMYGADPCTRAQAVAHEAGRVVVGYTVGETIEGAGIRAATFAGVTMWTGWTQHQHPDYQQPSEAPQRLFRSILAHLAGVLGEHVAGQWRTYSSPDEIEMATLSSSILVKYTDFAPRALCGFAEKIALDALARNRVKFDLIQAHLDQHTRLSGPDAVRLLTGAARFELEELPLRRGKA